MELVALFSQMFPFSHLACSWEQEKLLLSVLPRFVALEIISDIANQDNSRLLPTQFHKIYIHCYKDVR